MAQRDVVLRWIQQAARVIARLLRSGKPGDLELAKIEVDSAEEALLGSLARLIPHSMPDPPASFSMILRESWAMADCWHCEAR